MTCACGRKCGTFWPGTISSSQLLTASFKTSSIVLLTSIKVRDDVGHRPGRLRRPVALADPGTVIGVYDRPPREMLLSCQELVLVTADPALQHDRRRVARDAAAVAAQGPPRDAGGHLANRGRVGPGRRCRSALSLIVVAPSAAASAKTTTNTSAASCAWRDHIAPQERPGRAVLPPRDQRYRREPSLPDPPASERLVAAPQTPAMDDARDEIRLSEADFRLLSEAFLAEIEAKYR